MSNNTYWVDATEGVEFVEEDWTDNFGQGIEKGKVGLAVGDSVIEGTLDEIFDFGQRIAEAINTRVREHYDELYAAWQRIDAEVANFQQEHQSPESALSNIATHIADAESGTEV